MQVRTLTIVVMRMFRFRTIQYSSLCFRANEIDIYLYYYILFYLSHLVPTKAFKFLSTYWVYCFCRTHFFGACVTGVVVRVADLNLNFDLESLAPHCCGFEYRQGLWILSCAYRSSVVILVPKCTKEHLRSSSISKSGQSPYSPYSIYSISAT